MAKAIGRLGYVADMSDEHASEIICHAIEKAAGNGFIDDPEDWRLYARTMPHEAIGRLMLQHEFAKALWGDKEIQTWYSVTMGTGFTLREAWEFHLQNMVISEDAIAYLEESIK